MDTKYIFYYNTPVGILGIVEKDSMITNVFFGKTQLKENIIIKESELIKMTITELDEYFNGKRKSFSVKLNPFGTKFQRAVWDELIKIPYGETVSYKRIAENRGHDKAYRAVGLANHLNPIPIMIPCHRVIGSNGKLRGYAGGMRIKKLLLDLEKSYL